MSSTEAIFVYPESDERPHLIGDGPFWQESVVLIWADIRQGLFGFHRLGHEPYANAGAGISTTWIGIAHRDGTRFHRHVDLPLRPEHRTADSFLAGDFCRAEFPGDQAIWTINDPDCAMRIEARDYTPRFDLFRDGGTVSADFAPGHIEAAGRCHGSLRLGTMDFTIDALAYRDHSWGKRDWNSLLSHRWIAGTVGPGLTFNAAAWHGVDGSLRSFGIVVRDGVITYATKVDIVVFMEIDAQTHRGGTARLDLDDGSVVELSFEVVDGFLTHHNGNACVDELCTVEWGGQTGFADFEISTNPRAGTGPISGLVRATMEQGLSTREWSLT